LKNNEHLKPYVPYINVKIWDTKEQAKDTVIENDEFILTHNDSKNWHQGDLFRILALHKYGGLYCDFDVVFLRDFSPLLNQEFMYKWSYEKDMINGAVIRLFKDSVLSKQLLQEMKRTRSGSNFQWSSPLYTKIRKINKNWTVFPCAFFNTEWQIGGNPEISKIIEGDKELKNFISKPMIKTKYSTEFYDGSFSWHWHNSWKKEIENGSKWQLLEEKFLKEFKNKFNNR
jgi:mannosyltransferase OCH1-like enzyme